MPDTPAPALDLDAVTERAVTKRAVCGHDCPDQCSLRVTVGGGRAVRVEGDPAHPFTQGFACGKVGREHELVHSPDRLLTPLRRVGPKGSGRFEPMGWDEALDEVAGRWRRVVAEDGAAALAGYAYGGHQGRINRLLLNGLFEALGATRVDSATVCDSAASAAWDATMPEGLRGADPEDVLESDLIIAWGVDLATTNVHLWTLVQRARGRGARLVVIDPRRTKAAALADRHLRVPVGADAALALGCMHVMARDGLAARGWLARNAEGFGDFERGSLPGWTPERVEAEAGILAAEVEWLAREWAGARRPFLRLGLGLSRNARGGAGTRGALLAAAMAGTWERGGVLLAAGTAGALNLAPLAAPGGPGAARTVPLARLGRALEETRDPPIRALLAAASNPAVTCPDAARVRRALMREDLFTVVHAPFLSETARLADVVLPSATFLETADLYASYGGPWVQWAEASVAPPGEARSNADLARGLARRMGVGNAAFGLGDRDLARLMLEGAPLDRGAVMAGEPARLPPRPWSGRVRFAPLDWAREAGSGLRLLTAPGHFVAHTAYAAVPFLRARQGGPAVLLHPDEIGRRGLAAGREVELRGPAGSARFVLGASDEVAPGVALVVGFAGAVNDLVADDAADMGDGATYQSTWVEVSAVEIAAVG
jgi:anaerobic selenocysteine-containing dehydrogenase